MLQCVHRFLLQGVTIVKITIACGCCNGDELFFSLITLPWKIIDQVIGANG